MNILIVDNYDSFTYNLYHLVEAIMPATFRLSVYRNDQLSLDDVDAFQKIIISPGPGLPRDAGITCGLIRRYAPTKSILGVCLGHQAIAEVFGGRLLNLPEVLHGKAVKTIVTKPEEPLFMDCPTHFDTGRYHSWVVDPQYLPTELQVCATDEKGLIMAIRHNKYDIRGVQFHPESIMTPVGTKMLKNWVTLNLDNTHV